MLEMLDLEDILNFLLGNKYLLLIITVAGLIVHFFGFVYISTHRKKKDFSYSGYTYEWYEGSLFWLVLARIAWILGGLVLFVSFHCFIKIIKG